MKFSLPFLAKHIDQLPFPGRYQNEAVEAVLFHREDLEKTIWDEAWSNIAKASKLYQPKNVTFHFPVNDSDYVEDFFVAHRLKEALQRASDLGLHGVVVHSNRVRPLEKWKEIQIVDWQQKVINRLIEIREGVNETGAWLALENMPIMDNYGKEIDPLFVFPSDFKLLKDSNVKVVWDICHFTSTFANLKQLSAGLQQKKYYPHVKKMTPFDFVQIADQIAHWHFSAFLGIANPDTGSHCREGTLPKGSELGESLYIECLRHIIEQKRPVQHIVFEIQEEDYSKRLNGEKIMKWITAYYPHLGQC